MPPPYYLYSHSVIICVEQHAVLCTAYADWHKPSLGPPLRPHHQSSIRRKCMSYTSRRCRGYYSSTCTRSQARVNGVLDGPYALLLFGGALSDTCFSLAAFYLPNITCSLADTVISHLTYTPAHCPRGAQRLFRLSCACRPTRPCSSVWRSPKPSIRYTEHPPDAQRGWDLPPTVLVPVKRLRATRSERCAWCECLPAGGPARVYEHAAGRPCHARLQHAVQRNHLHVHARRGHLWDCV